jgi:hypothetical protein
VHSVVGVELVPSCITVTFRSILVTPITRDRSLAMARCRCRLRQMAEGSKDHVVVIGSQTQHLDLVDGTWLNWRLGWALRGK